MNSMTDEKMPENMAEMQNNSFLGEVPQEPEMTPESVMMGLFKNQIIVLEEKLVSANAEFGKAVRNPNMHWMERNDRKTECKILEGQINVIKQLQNNFECICKHSMSMM